MQDTFTHNCPECKNLSSYMQDTFAHNCPDLNAIWAHCPCCKREALCKTLSHTTVLNAFMSWILGAMHARLSLRAMDSSGGGRRQLL